jgi:hypothetical protein
MNRANCGIRIRAALRAEQWPPAQPLRGWLVDWKARQRAKSDPALRG